jgi:formate dehydrogenase major subunit
MKRLSRRELMAAGGGLLGGLGLDLGTAVASARETAKEPKKGRVTTTICPYCAVGCSALVTSVERDGRWVAINVEGDPDHRST